MSAVRTVGRPAPAVFSFVSDAANNPSWQRGMRSCRWTSPPPIGVGSTYEQRARFLGRDIATTFEVVEFEPGRSITIRSNAGSFPITVRRRVEPLDATTTRVHAEIDGGPGRFFLLAGPLVRRLAQRSVDGDYDRLVEVLSSQ